MPELSIIVPVYKVEKYLSKCVDSILAQTFTDFELILIDDGSPDRCGEICDEYAARDSRIIVIHQKNQGVSAARNAGLDNSRGSFIGFVDADDWIAPNMYARMLSEMKANHADIIFCGMNECDEGGCILRKKKNRMKGAYERDELLSALFRKPIPIGGSVCCAVFLKSRINAHRFHREIQMKEDILFLFDVIEECNIGLILEESLYFVRLQQESATRKCLSKALVNTLPANDILLRRSAAYSLELDRLASDKMLDDGIRFMRMIRADRFVDRSMRRKCLRKVKRFFWKVFLRSLFARRLTGSQLHGYLNNYFHTK